MGFSNIVRTNILLKCKRHCCLCGKYAGIYMELHHIKQKSDGGNDTEDNCIPLCFKCHADVRSYNPHHPKGLKYGDKELIARREEIYNCVKNKIIDIYSSEDISKAQKLMNKYNKGLETLIQTAPSGERIDVSLVDFAESISNELQTYEYVFDNVELNQEKCVLIDAVMQWYNILNNNNNFHILDDGHGLCFNSNTVNQYREIITNLRITIRDSYWKFRTAATIISHL
ncbi:HNH endonuclease [Clostridium botulinum]|nr:HNH endonuclease [Clostridium botulinum]NFP28411.1 HNH endonuclease [Clostridium botulinum]